MMTGNFFKNLSPRVIKLSIFSLFVSFSTQMLYAELALVLKYNFYAPESLIALIDGAVEFFSYFVRIFSGFFGDFFVNKYSLLVFGSFLSAILKPVFAFASSFMLIFFAEITERFANGIQACPRDALIKEECKAGHTAESFGFNRVLKTLGALLGTLCAILIINKWDYKVLFLLASLPALFSLYFILDLYKPTKTFKSFDKKISLKNIDKSIYKILLFAFFCELAHFSEALLSIKASEFLSYKSAGITVLFMSLGQMFFSYQIGVLADKFDRLKLLFFAISISIFANLILISSQNILSVFIGVFFLCGSQNSLQCIFLAIISDKVNNGRGVVIGIYFCVLGLAYFLSSIFAGNLWTNFGSKTAFSYSLVVNIFALVNCFLLNKSFSFRCKF